MSKRDHLAGKIQLPFPPDRHGALHPGFDVPSGARMPVGHVFTLPYFAVIFGSISEFHSSSGVVDVYVS